MAERGSLGALATVGAGCGLLAASLACGGGGGQEPTTPDAPAPADSTAPQGRSFLDEAPPVPSDQVTTADRKAAEGTIEARSGAGVRRPSGLGDFAAGVDPSLLTPEALARNPLVIGTKEREPFVLAEGADPLDPESYDWDRDEDGYWIISYSDLSLEGVDKDLLLDALVYPEEYEDDEVIFPDRIRALDGQKVALTGYMIAVTWDDDRVKNFMLVRDLMACCFGGSPEPDEWVDVMMVGKGSPYIQFVPVVTRGTFHIQGLSDDAGYATGAFRMDGVDTREE